MFPSCLISVLWHFDKHRRPWLCRPSQTTRRGVGGGVWASPQWQFPSPPSPPHQPAQGLSAAPGLPSHLPDLTCSCLQPSQVP